MNERQVPDDPDGACLVSEVNRPIGTFRPVGHRFVA